MKFVYRGPDRNVDLLAGVVHGHAGEWHPVLPTDQSPDTTVFCLHRTQSTTVAITPYQPFCMIRHQLAVNIRQLCLGRNRKQTVVEGPVSRTRLNPLVYSHHDVNFRSPAASNKAVISGPGIVTLFCLKRANTCFVGRCSHKATLGHTSSQAG